METNYQEEIAKLNARLDSMGKAFLDLKRPEDRRYFTPRHCSDITHDLDTAHALALKELRNVPRLAQANRNSYAKVEHCTDYVNPILGKFELCVKQVLAYNEFGEDILITRFSHKSGQWYESVTLLKFDRNNSQSINQQYGSSITYMRRYALLAILGIGQMDDPMDNDR